MKKTTVLILGFVLSLAFTVEAQQSELDSLWTIWNNTSNADSTRIDAMSELAWDGYLFSQPDSAFICAQAGYELAEKAGMKRKMAALLNTQGASFWVRGIHSKALLYFNKSLLIYEEEEDLDNAAACLNNMGVINRSQGNNLKALNLFLKSLNIREQLQDSSRLPNIMSNIGLIYQDQGNYAKALVYYQKSLDIRESLNDTNKMAGSLTNIGLILQIEKDYDGALEYFEKSLGINKHVADKKGEANSLNNIGLLYKEQGATEKALTFLEQSLAISTAIGDSNGIASSLISMGTIEIENNSFDKAIEFCNNAMVIADKIGDVLMQKEAYNCLFQAYKSRGNATKALEIHEKLSEIEENLEKNETARQLQKMEFNKQLVQDSIANVAKQVEVRLAHEKEVESNNQSKNIAFATSLFVLVLAGVMYSRLRFVRKSKAALQEEKDRSENLLLNILPKEIAQELKEKGKADARDFGMVSILFSDFKGFTEQSAKLSAADLVHEINHCFEAFDGIMEKYNIEKIKTIGDAYMAAGGLPVPTDDSVKNTVLAALEMQAFIKARKKTRDEKNLPAFEMRVGIHTGPVVAGIVGLKKFQYDIWGDTVNTANRMESHGEVSKVNISQVTYELLKADSEFAFESRGKIDAKGKGEIEMYFVTKK